MPLESEKQLGCQLIEEGMERILHMNGGVGETSYARNSTMQHIIVSMTKAVRQAAAADWCFAGGEKACHMMSIADLGCSSGLNTLVVTSDIVEAVEESCRKLGRPCPEFEVLLNDLPGNDFNTIFSLLPEFHRRRGILNPSRCFIYGVPGSFYGRLFPSRSLHFVHSSSSLHWLSKVPFELSDGTKESLNRGKVYISKGSPHDVLKAYLKQFQSDFSLFLNSRAEEIVVEGYMVLTLMGRRSSDPSTQENCYQWELLAQALMDMATQDLVDEDKLNSFNAPYYAPSAEELKNEIESEGSFTIKHLKLFESSWDDLYNYKNIGNKITKEKDSLTKELNNAQFMANGVRAVLESMLVSHFGEGIIEELFTRYTSKLYEYYIKNKAEVTNIVVSMVRNT